MRDRTSRLQLHRETIRELDPRDLDRVAGGMDSSELCRLATGALAPLSNLNECVTNAGKCYTSLCLT